MALLGRRTIHLTFWSLPAQKPVETLPCSELRAHRKRKYVPANLVAAPLPRQPAADPTTTASICQAPAFTKHPIFFIFFFTYTAPPPIIPHCSSMAVFSLGFFLPARSTQRGGRHTLLRLSSPRHFFMLALGTAEGAVEGSGQQEHRTLSLLPAPSEHPSTRAIKSAYTSSRNMKKSKKIEKNLQKVEKS